MDRENSLTLLWPEWGSNPIPPDPQSEVQPIAPQARAEFHVWCISYVLVEKFVCKRKSVAGFFFVIFFSQKYFKCLRDCVGDQNKSADLRVHHSTTGNE
jgi:hypothetical protein